jgi:uncharacterized protein
MFYSTYMNILHDPEQKKFYIPLDSDEAILSYSEEGKVLDFYRVYVPAAFRNRGIAGKITIFAFEYAAKNGYQVIPTCPFISHEFLPRFPKYQQLVHK